MTNDPAPSSTIPRDWAAYKYVLLWVLALVSIIVGLILLSQETVTIWTPTGYPDESTASFVSLTPWGQPLLEGGSALAMILLLLDVYVGRRSQR